MKTPLLFVFATIAVLAAGSPRSLAADPSTNAVWRYTLLPESQLTDDCDICGRPTILARLQGTFDLQLLGCDPLYCQYAWAKVRLSAEAGTGMSYFLEGEGVYQLGGEVAVFQNLLLSLYTDLGHTNEVRYFTNTTAKVERLWPMIKISLDETNPTLLQHLRLDISAAPMHEIWFSTRTSLTDGFWQPPTNRVSSGDLIASTGRVVKDHQLLSGQLGVMPPAPDLGLKDIDVLPGGEIVFSIEQDVFSESLGPLSQGDLVSNQGRLVATNAQLIAAFDPDKGTGDVGLSGVQVFDSGEIYFSVQTNFLSQSLGRMIGPGDLLSTRGVVVRSNAELLARFFPAEPGKDYGLACIYMWPSGEIWFATQNGFTSTNGQTYLGGDLLSDQGYVVYRNLDLLGPFAPVEDLFNFGLDALFVVTDVTASPPSGKLTSITVDQQTGGVTVQFNGAGKVWQLERAASASGPWTPASAIGTDLSLADNGVWTNLPQGFYRVRQW
jgi:hypothetical protein